VAKTVNFVPTNPEEQTCVIGPLINERQLRRVEAMVNDALAAGAKARCGGTAEGAFFAATVLTDVTTDMSVWRDEIFGPVTTVTPFDTVDEALAMANDTDYGLTASVVTRDTLKGEALAEKIHAGMVHVNDSTVHDEPHCPFSGLGASGGGGKWGPKGAIEAFTTQRWISTQREPHALPF
jgi:acyl-CoA reductase-like NAD-dependent aldehyde dehydrogenase